MGHRYSQKRPEPYVLVLLADEALLHPMRRYDPFGPSTIICPLERFSDTIVINRPYRGRGEKAQSLGSRALIKYDTEDKDGTP